MSIYIVQPRSPLANSTIELISTRLAPASRQAQVEEILALRREDPVDQDIQRWIEESLPHGVTRISHNDQHGGISSMTVVDMPDAEADRMRQELPDILIVRDRPLDLIHPRQSAVAATDTVSTADLWHLRAIGLEAARAQGFTGTGQGITVAVLDTGVDATHPELVGKITATYGFDVAQWQVHRLEKAEDTHGHGTHIAGIIGGKTIGVAPGVDIISGIMLPSGQGRLSDFVLALEWVGTQPEIQIVNMSAGIAGYLPEMRPAVETLVTVGVLPVVAVGNEGRNRTRSPGNYIEVISVGAMTREQRVASFSGGGILVAENHQYIVPDLVAPGEQIYSSIVGGGYAAWDGTSMATAVVSGVAALMLEKYPDITVTDLEEALVLSCTDLGIPEDRQGRGLIQIGKLV